MIPTEIRLLYYIMLLCDKGKPTRWTANDPEAFRMFCSAWDEKRYTKEEHIERLIKRLK